METIEQQAKSIIENYLKSLKISFDLDSEETVDYYTLFVGSEEANIQVEYITPEKTEDELCAHFYYRDNRDNELYDNGSYIYKTAKEIEDEIDELISAVKSLNRLKAKIQGYLDKIDEALDDTGFSFEHNVTVEDFLSR